MSKNWELVLPHRCLLGEGPVWDADNKKIIWLDIMKGEIHQFSQPLAQHEVMSVGQTIGAIALKTSGGWIAALQHGFATIDMEKKTIEPIADPEEGLSKNRFNDGKCDPSGNFWAGTMDHINDESGAGNLYVLKKDLSISVRIKQVTCSNGMAWSLDHKTFYYIDSPTRQVVAYDFDVKHGVITNKKVIITIPVEEGYPDGMTIDREGMLWIAHWDGWKVSRWNPLSGKLIHQFLLPVARVTSCTFGGEAMNDLYVTSAYIGLNENDLQVQPLSGCLFVIRNCGFEGHAPFRFEG
ncbi:MAG: SMP-30/gluconolactonase/LRE family protein [Chitinophagaceae bacterium]